MVKNLTDTITSKKSSLAPLILDLRNCRTSYTELEVGCLFPLVRTPLLVPLFIGLLLPPSLLPFPPYPFPLSPSSLPPYPTSSPLPYPFPPTLPFPPYPTPSPLPLPPAHKVFFNEGNL